MKFQWKINWCLKSHIIVWSFFTIDLFVTSIGDQKPKQNNQNNFIVAIQKRSDSLVFSLLELKQQKQQLPFWSFCFWFLVTNWCNETGICISCQTTEIKTALKVMSCDRALGLLWDLIKSFGLSTRKNLWIIYFTLSPRSNSRDNNNILYPKDLVSRVTSWNTMWFKLGIKEYFLFWLYFLFSFAIVVRWPMNSLDHGLRASAHLRSASPSDRG